MRAQPALPASCAALLSLVIVASIVTVGCSTPSIDGAPITSSKPKSKRRPTTTTGDAGESSPEGQRQGPTTPADTDNTPAPATDAGTTPPATGVCASNATKTSCFRCCEDQNPQGIKFLTQAFDDCACGTGAGNCAAECAGSFCAGAPPSATCEQCLNVANTCQVQADTACEQNTVCAAMFACDQSSQCAAKP